MKIRRKNILTLAVHALTATLAGGLAQAQSNTPAPAQLEQVVVSASASARKLADAPASITVITRDQLAREPFGNVQDALARVEGLSVVGSGNNDTDIVLRGMPGEYTLMLVDGRRQSTRETMNRSTGGVQAHLLPPLAAIERIEIVRGPMSALYGADAMGGVINIITRAQLKRWGGSVSLGGVRQFDGRLGHSSQADFWFGGPLIAEQLSLQIWGGMGRRSEDLVLTGSPANDERSLTAKLSWTPLAGQQLAFEAGSGRFESEARPGQTLAASDVITEAEHSREHWAVSHQAALPFGRLRSALYQEQGRQRLSAAAVRNPVEPEATNTVLDSMLSLPLGSQHLHLGLQLQRNVLNGVAQEAPTAGHPDSRNRISSQASALFAEDEIEISPDFALTLGLRMDHEQRYGSHWSPRAYGIYQLGQGWSLRGGVGSGFKAPKLRQAEASYCMSTGGNSPRRGSLCGNPGLKPETSRSTELGLRWDASPRQHLALTVFSNNFSNKVVSYNTGKVDPLNTRLDVYVYDNVDTVRINGLELVGDWALTPALTVSGHYSYTQSKRSGGKETQFSGASLDGFPLDKTPAHMASVKLDWQVLPGLRGFARLNHESEQQWAALRNGALGVRTRAALHTVDLGLSWKPLPQWTLSAALLNAGDKQIPLDLRARNAGLDGNWMVDEGRRLALKLGVEF